jgi:23S rRNA pseudouridine2604 synthase
MGVRINKYLSEAGLTSRRGGDAVVEEERVTIDGRVAKLGDVVEEGQVVTLNGQVVGPRAEKYYLLFNKPVGVITTTDPEARDNIMEAVEAAGWPVKEKRVFPIGRLDVASSGIILITNDSELGERMLRKEGQHEKEYLVTVDKPVSAKHVAAWEHGVEILDHQMTLPAKVRLIKPDHFSITIVQGLNRQIRRMCEGFGYEVLSLKRVRIMSLHLDQLLPGQFRELHPNEVAKLRLAVGLATPPVHLPPGSDQGRRIYGPTSRAAAKPIVGRRLPPRQ